MDYGITYTGTNADAVIAWARKYGFKWEGAETLPTDGKSFNLVHDSNSAHAIYQVGNGHTLSVEEFEQYLPKESGERAVPMSKAAHPYVGQIVQYISRGSADDLYPSTARAAIVTEIHWSDAANSTDWKGDRQSSQRGDDQAPEYINGVSICVINPSGIFFDEFTSFDDDVELLGGTWRFIPEPRAGA